MAKSLILLLYVAIIPTFDVGRVLQMIKNIAWDTAKWLATRALAISLCLTVVPIGIYYGWCLIVQKLFEAASTAGSGWTGTAIQLTGMGAWIGNQIGLGEAFAIFTSALSLKFTLSFFRR